jgi:putative transposase
MKLEDRSLSDNDGKFGAGFARVAHTSHSEILKTPSYAQRANAICERFLGSVRRECLDHLLILHEKQHEPRAQRV